MNVIETLKCGNNEIIGGDYLAGSKNDNEINPVGFWPWMASLGYFDEEDKWTHKCGATLISQQHFLTAAHCAANTK